MVGNNIATTSHQVTQHCNSNIEGPTGIKVVTTMPKNVVATGDGMFVCKCIVATCEHVRLHNKLLGSYGDNIWTWLFSGNGHPIGPKELSVQVSHEDCSSIANLSKPGLNLSNVRNSIPVFSFICVFYFFFFFCISQRNVFVM